MSYRMFRERAEIMSSKLNPDCRISRCFKFIYLLFDAINDYKSNEKSNEYETLCWNEEQAGLFCNFIHTAFNSTVLRHPET